MKHLCHLAALLLIVLVPASAAAQERGRGGGAGRGTAPGLTITVQVTDQSGNPLPDVAVSTSGPVDRSGTTGQEGTVVLRTMRAGTYRLRFEHDDYVTFEREVVLRTQSQDVSVALNAARAQPPPPPAQKPAPDAAPPPPPKPARNVAPSVLSLPDYLDRQLIGSEPQRLSLLACAEGGTANLLQVRDPMTGEQHGDADEVLYVVAGNGIVRIGSQDTRVEPGHFLLIPRSMPHNIRRDGRNPLILLAVRAGAPCNETAAPVK